MNDMNRMDSTNEMKERLNEVWKGKNIRVNESMKCMTWCMNQCNTKEVNE